MISNTMTKIAVIGAGSWGTTLAILMSEKGHDVIMWARRQDHAKDISDFRENTQYLPGKKFPEKLNVDFSLQNVLKDSEIIFSVVPCQHVREISHDVKKYYNGQIVVSASKGMEHGTGKRMSEIIQEVLGENTKVAVLSGPNHAEEVSNKMPCASVIAASDKETCQKVLHCLNTTEFKVYPLDDVVGVEICGAMKNITAIATGVCDGLNFGDNAKSSIITLGLMEMNNFVKHFGAKRGTIYGLAGVGDLIATCMSKHSRNRFVGEKLASGKLMDEIKKEMHGMVAEGIYTTKAVYEYSKKHNIEMPLTHQAYEVLYKNKNLKNAMVDLLNLI
jgi:glycerol-3-phosphate dehydrogenase (NAD(P)+)